MLQTPNPLIAITTDIEPPTIAAIISIIANFLKIKLFLIIARCTAPKAPKINFKANKPKIGLTNSSLKK